MITVAQLQTFAALARTRHFTRAAAELGVAQPSVSYHVRALERQLGVRFVEIVGRQMQLTDAGEQLAKRASALLNDLAALERDMAEYRAGAMGRLRLGATRTIGGYALPAVLACYTTAHPDVMCELTIDNTAAIERRLLARELDLAVVEWTVESTDLTSRPLRPDALVLVAPRHHPFAARASIRPDELRGQPFVAREHGSGTRALAEAALGPITRDLRVVIAFDQPEAIVRAVQAGMGLAFLSETIVAPHVARGALRVIPVEGLRLGRDFSLVSLRGRVITPAMTAFMELLEATWTKGRRGEQGMMRGRPLPTFPAAGEGVAE